MQQTLDERRTGNESQAQKESYQININKYFDDFSLVETINTIRIGIVKQKNNTAIPKYSFKLGGYWAQNINLTASASFKKSGYQDDAISLYFTIPLSQGSSVSFLKVIPETKMANAVQHIISVIAGYSEQRNYNLNVGYQTGSHQNDQTSFSGYLNQNLPYASISGNASYVPNDITALGDQ